MLGLVSNPSKQGRETSSQLNSAWLLPAASAPGPLAQRYRKIIGPPRSPLAAVLSPNAAVTFALTPTLHSGKRTETLGAQCRRVVSRVPRDRCDREQSLVAPVPLGARPQS